MLAREVVIEFPKMIVPVIPDVSGEVVMRATNGGVVRSSENVDGKKTPSTFSE